MSGRSTERYLDAIYHLQQETGSPVSTSSLASAVGVSSASVSGMLRRLAEDGLVDHTPYHGVTLTEAGLRRAASLSRRHCLWEVFLSRYLGLAWEDVYREACRLEHSTSPEVEERLSAFLGDPDACPHGYPIPSTSGSTSAPRLSRLSALCAGQQATVLRIREGNREVVRYLASLGLVPGAEITVREIAPFDGPLTVQIGDSIKAIARDVAGGVMVRPGRAGSGVGHAEPAGRAVDSQSV